MRRMAGASDVYATRRPLGRLGGWPIVGWASALIGLTTVVTVVSAASGEQAAHHLLRATALTSVLFFSAAFTASSLRKLWPRPATRWMLENRRYLGVSFAVSHAVHLSAIVWLAVFAADRFEVAGATLIGGGLGFVFVAAMAVTSFDRTAAWLGPRPWKLLHTVGGYYLWFIFVFTYLGNLGRSVWLGAPLALLLAVLALRIAARARRG